MMVKEEMNWPSWWKNETAMVPIATQWNVRGWSTTYVLDPKGVIRYKQVHRENSIRRSTIPEGDGNEA